jgi:UDP-2,4-diacetamido-2,4,6-trideoxy-beta-L-altropyranose hydrolase/pseudaminic acid synthase
MGVDFVAIKTAKNQIEMYKYLVRNHYLTLEKFDAMKLKKILEGLLYG